ncbi:serine/threonine protein kinase [Streptomyces sp. NPDC058740]|uniref:serine/threonine protein kinase n=1 Tax=Streptomyces sp. NPDC058740 TaxID=3346619 RepID=UPI00369592EC
MERPYRLITRLDPPPPQTDPASPSASSPASSPALSPVPCRRFVARDATGDRTVHLTAPLPGTDPTLFRGEAETSQRLALPWTFPVTEIGGGTVGSEAWFATPYVPALPLPVALAVHGGPLPLETVRVIGVALAETLAVLHAQGTAHAGVAPAAVLLTADGPRLTCFGAARTTDRVDRAAQAPEQATGGLPRPPGDVYGLGAVLAYAATGHTAPESGELPPALGTSITACLTHDPANRPSAASLLAALTPPPPPASHEPHSPRGPQGSHEHSPHQPHCTHGTLLDAPPQPPLLTPGWLPPRVVAALARQSAALLAAGLPDSPGN